LATVKHYTPGADLADLDALLGVVRGGQGGAEEGGEEEREATTAGRAAIAAAWARIAGSSSAEDASGGGGGGGGGGHNAMVLALSPVCDVDARWPPPCGNGKAPFPRGVTPHVQGDTATTKRGRNQRQYCEGVRVFSQQLTTRLTY